MGTGFKVLYLILAKKNGKVYLPVKQAVLGFVESDLVDRFYKYVSESELVSKVLLEEELKKKNCWKS